MNNFKILIRISLALIVSIGLLPAQLCPEDTCDVTPGYETLNLAVEGDTTAAGEPANLNRVYRLARGGAYLLNGSVEGLSGVHLRVVAEAGAGPRPLIIPAVDVSGFASRAFRPNDDGTFKGLYITGRDDLGNFTSDMKNMFRLEKDDGRYVVDNCFLDYEFQSLFRMNADNIKLFITNSILRNCYEPADASDSKMIDTRGNPQDTILVQNNTLYAGSGRIIRSDKTEIYDLIFDHNTVVQFGDRLEVEKVVNATITNNLFLDINHFGTIYDAADPADTMWAEVIDLDSLDAPAIAAEEDRQIVISHNSFAWSPELTAWYTANGVVQHPVPLHQPGLFMIATFPNMVYENNIAEFPAFSDPLPLDSLLAFMQHGYDTDYSDIGNPLIYHDRNGIGSYYDLPGSVGPAADEFDFDYADTEAAYGHGIDGFPLGDLNWFPDLKAIWDAGGTIGTDNDSQTLPTQFSLEQNYPNPFNPTTSITYQLHASAAVKLTIFNILGQNVRTLVNEAIQSTGEYMVQWNGLNDAGIPVVSGLYIYQLESENNLQTKKMLLIK
ncbi:MAG: T9SS type A sorting domain-containing protein [Candidatus Marinimicrobia bacterium]|nr:T9SS type A sorting domain-containing protein [Candidatus Neomarinimicrobiota bacterium]